MISLTFDLGDRPRSTWSFTSEGALADPPTVLFIVRDPAGTEQVSAYGVADEPYPITRSSAGVYYADIPLTSVGTWTRRWVALDEGDAPLDAFESNMRVRATAYTEPLG